MNWRSVKSRASAFHTGPTSCATASFRARASAAAVAAAAASASAPARRRRHARIARSTSSSEGAKTASASASEPSAPNASSSSSARGALLAKPRSPRDTASIASRVSFISLAITSNNDKDALALPRLAVRGVTPYRSLCLLCFSLRRATSLTASFIAFVYGSSAKRIAVPRLLRAARPIICISERDERANPGTPASSTITRLTCGTSNPSRRSCAPTRQSNSPCCNFCNFTARSFAVNPLCSQSARTPPIKQRYPARSSQSVLVKAHTRLASPRAARRRTAAASAGSCSFLGRIVTKGSSTPEGRTTMSTMPTPSSSVLFAASDADVFPGVPERLLSFSATSNAPDAHQAASVSPGVALTRSAFGTRAQNSSKLSGRLSSALGSRYPPLTKPSFRERSPPCMARSCGSITCDSSATSNHSREPL